MNSGLVRRNEKRKLVRGVGINDYDGQVIKYLASSGNLVIEWRCPIYATWARMLERCYGKTYRSASSAYIGCSVHESWHRFSEFRKWMINQDWSGKELDKDLIIKGNKVYQEDRCIFVSKMVNKFLSGCGEKPRKYPVGVTKTKNSGRFVALCSNPFTGKQERLGVFDSAAQAHSEWQIKKHSHALDIAGMQDDTRIADALVARFAPGTRHDLMVNNT